MVHHLDVLVVVAFTMLPPRGIYTMMGNSDMTSTTLKMRSFPRRFAVDIVFDLSMDRIQKLAD